jgi:hypothetical protein
MVYITKKPALLTQGAQKHNFTQGNLFGFPAPQPATSNHYKKVTMKYLALQLLFFMSSFAAIPGLDTLVNYDTTWTFVYDGGMKKVGYGPMDDVLYDVREYTPNGCVAVGLSGDTSNSMQALLMEFGADGKIILNKMYDTKLGTNTFFNDFIFHSVTIAKNGDFLVGGRRYAGPLIMRLDQQGNAKWTMWYFDSTRDVSGLLIDCSGAVNCIRETSRGTIICAVGYHYNDDGYIFGNKDYNCAGLLVLDATGKKLHGGNLYEEGGYFIGGSSVEEAPDGNYLVAGNQTLNCIDTAGNTQWQRNFSFQLDGGGLEVNNIVKCKKLRNNSFIIAGRAYEGNCLKRYKKLYYDAWWSPMDPRSGTNSDWDTAGAQGSNDNLNDFTQLNNGNLVFIGFRGGGLVKGLWTFVTDSTGKKLLWEKVTPIPYRSLSNIFTPVGISVCATADSGFTVVGKINFPDSLGGTNAFVAHYKPKETSGVVWCASSRNDVFSGFSVHGTGSRFTIQSGLKNGSNVNVALFDCRGRCIAVCNGKGEIVFDLSTAPQGMYFVRIKADGVVKTKMVQILTK